MIVTSFGPEGFGQYGKQFIETFLRFRGVHELIVYHEGPLPEEAPQAPGVSYIDMEEFPEFQDLGNQLNASDPLFKGLMQSPKTEGETVYNFRFDAFKFFRKVLAMNHYNRSAPQEPFAWIDADVVFHKELPEDFFQDLLAGKYVAYLGRPGLYTETGFLAFDPTYEGHEEFFNLYWKTYSSGAFRYFSEWHDCWVFDFVRSLLKPPGRNIAKGCDPMNPMCYSVLGPYMDHKKGDRKDAA